MKSLKTQFIGAIAMVLVAAIAMGSSTYAWFAMNKEVTATNMQVTATADGSLVITTGSAPTTATSSTTVAMADQSATALLASTHDLSVNPQTSALNYATGLKYVTNPAEVSATTGLKLGSTELAFANAANGDGKVYYKDYTVYIASSGSQLTGQDLTATIIAPTGVTKLPAATSIDFYYTTDGTAASESSTFAGTLNLAGLDPVTNDSNTTKTTAVMSDITIPKADGSAAIVVLMRVYIDGALKDSSTTTYIKTVNAADIAAQTLSVKFTATTHVTSGGSGNG